MGFGGRSPVVALSTSRTKKSGNRGSECVLARMSEKGHSDPDFFGPRFFVARCDSTIKPSRSGLWRRTTQALASTMIFDPIRRTDPSPKLSIESDFQFLNRSSRVEMDRARGLMEDLISIYPEPEDLVGRFRSGDNNNYRSAEFELLLFGALKNLGFDLQPHPAPPNGTNARPDFLITCPSGESFYLEAVLASEHTGDQTYHPLVATTLDVLSANSHKNFGVMVRTRGVPTTQPSRKRLLRETLRWLDSLDPDEVQGAINRNGHDASPTMDWSHEDFTVSMKALPLREGRRGKASRLLAVQFGQAGWVDSWSAIRDAVKYKGSKYGLLDKPLVIAVNFAGHHLDRRDEMQALFGQDQVTFAADNPDMEPRLTRAPNGAWLGAGGPQFTRVSGAWLFDNLCVYNVPSRNPTLYLHPWARHPVPVDLLRFTHAVGVDGSVSWKGGLAFGPVFNLPPEWPSGP